MQTQQGRDWVCDTRVPPKSGKRENLAEKKRQKVSCDPTQIPHQAGYIAQVLLNSLPRDFLMRLEPDTCAPPTASDGCLPRFAEISTKAERKLANATVCFLRKQGCLLILGRGNVI